MPTCSFDAGRASGSTSSQEIETNHLPVGVRLTMAEIAHAFEGAMHVQLHLPSLESTNLPSGEKEKLLPCCLKASRS